MNRKKRIEQILKKNMPKSSIIVEDLSNLHKGHGQFDGTQETHFKITLSIKNKNYSKLFLHRKINKCLKKEFDSGLHALEINMSK